MALNRLFNRLRFLEALHNVAPDLVHHKINSALEKQYHKSEKVTKEVPHKSDQPQDTLFVTDISGYVKEFSVDTFELYKNCGKMHERSIKVMKTTKDGKVLFTTGYDRHLKQWKINTKKNEIIPEKTNELIVHNELDKERIDKNKENIDQNQEYIQEISGYEIIKDYGEISQTSVTAMVLSEDENFLYTGDSNGILKIWDVKKMCLHTAWGKVHSKEIIQISINSLNNNL